MATLSNIKVVFPAQRRYVTCIGCHNGARFSLSPSTLLHAWHLSVMQSNIDLLIPSGTPSGQVGTVWSGMTKAQLWLRLTNAPDFTDANMVYESHPGLLGASDGLK